MKKIISLLVPLILLSCTFLYDNAEMIDNRKKHSIIRFDGRTDKAKGEIHTNGIYIYESFMKDPQGGLSFLGLLSPREEHVSTLGAFKFFDDGTFIRITLYGNDYDSIKQQLKGFSINEIYWQTFGLYSVLNKKKIYVEDYIRNTLIEPYELSKDSFEIINDTTLSMYYNHRHHKLVFLSCSIPITSHHPFKSKRFLWNDKKARKQYLREWKKIKKERKKSKIKYSYE
ncbi:MAG: hypothetical protein IKX22_07010 [Prevotella sp.]|nr:hypothetical protein [Prevotella sp.]